MPPIEFEYSPQQKPFGAHVAGETASSMESFKLADIAQQSPKTAEADYTFATSRANRELLEIGPLRYHPVKDKAPNNLVASSTERVLCILKDDFDAIETDSASAKAIIFTQSFTKNKNGMLGYRSEFKNGATGVSITSTPKISEGEDMKVFGRKFLGRSLTQDGIILVGNPDNAAPESAYGISMEIGTGGKVEFSERDEGEAFKELALRTLHLSGGKFMTKHTYTDDLDPEVWNNAELPSELIENCSNLAEMGLLPYVAISTYVKDRARAVAIQLLVGGGLSEGQASTYDTDTGLVWITESGTNKGDLKRNQIIALSGMNDDFNGVVLPRPESEKRKKPSVESLDNLLFNIARGAVKEGMINSSDIAVFKSLIKDPQAVKAALDAVKGSPFTVDHIHMWPKNWSDRYVVVDASPRLVPKQAYQSGCGTLALALATTQSAIEGMLQIHGEENDLGLILLMPNHGLTLLENKRPVEVIDKLNTELKRDDSGRLTLSKNIPLR